MLLQTLHDKNKRSREYCLSIRATAGLEQNVTSGNEI